MAFKFLNKVKANLREKTVTREVLENSCNCYALSCCPCPHFKLDSIAGDGIDYIWNLSGTVTVGTLAQFQAACDLAKNPVIE